MNKKFIRQFLIIALFFVLAFSQTSQAVSGLANKAASDQSSFEYKRYMTNAAYKKALKSMMPSVYVRLATAINDKSTFPIPGLVVTYTTSGGYWNYSDNFIPQGLCKAGKYWLVTAYDSEKEYPSVIYVIDKEADKVVSTLSLPNKYHLGGIAFDGNNIWLTGQTSDKYKGTYFVQYIRFDDLLTMIKDDLHTVTKSEISGKVYIKNKPSFLTCANGKLWVGTYIGSDESKEGYINGYTIIDNDKGVKLNTTLYSVITGIDSSTQGIDIDGNYLYVSSSYKGYVAGVKSSFVTKYEIGPLLSGTGGNYLYADDREVVRIEVPKMNEEIVVDGGLIYICFESAANKYFFSVISTDRILAVKKSTWVQ